MKKVAGDALVNFHSQYPPLMGVPELLQAVAAHSEREQVGRKQIQACVPLTGDHPAMSSPVPHNRVQGIPVDPIGEVLITVGATEGLAACFFGLLNPGEPHSPLLREESSTMMLGQPSQLG